MSAWRADLAACGRQPGIWQAIVAEVNLKDTALFEACRNEDAEGPAMGYPTDTVGKILSRENLMQLLRKGHLTKICRNDVVVSRWDIRHVTVSAVRAKKENRRYYVRS